MKRTIELLEIEGILLDDRLNDRTATLCTGQCKPFGTVLDAATVANRIADVLSRRSPP